MMIGWQSMEVHNLETPKLANFLTCKNDDSSAVETVF